MPNNLSQKEIVLLYKFLICFERNIKNLINDKSLGNISNQYKNILVSEKLNIFQLQRGQIVLQNIIKPNEIFMTKSKNSLMLSFLNHIRNSIAHGLIYRVGRNYQLKDSGIGGLTMNGIISKQCLEAVIVLFNNYFKI